MILVSLRNCEPYKLIPYIWVQNRRCLHSLIISRASKPGGDEITADELQPKRFSLGLVLLPPQIEEASHMHGMHDTQQA